MCELQKIVKLHVPNVNICRNIENRIEKASESFFLGKVDDAIFHWMEDIKSDGANHSVSSILIIQSLLSRYRLRQASIWNNFNTKSSLNFIFRYIKILNRIKIFIAPQKSLFFCKRKRLFPLYFLTSDFNKNWIMNMTLKYPLNFFILNYFFFYWRLCQESQFSTSTGSISINIKLFQLSQKFLQIFCKIISQVRELTTHVAKTCVLTDWNTYEELHSVFGLL